MTFLSVIIFIFKPLMSLIPEPAGAHRRGSSQVCENEGATHCKTHGSQEEGGRQSSHRVQAFPGQSRGSPWKWALHVRCCLKAVLLRIGILDISHMDGQTYAKAVRAKSSRHSFPPTEGHMGSAWSLLPLGHPVTLLFCNWMQFALLYLASHKAGLEALRRAGRSSES